MAIASCVNVGGIRIASASFTLSPNVGGIVGSIDEGYLYAMNSVNYGNLSVSAVGSSSIGGVGGYVKRGNAAGCINAGDIDVAHGDALTAGGNRRNPLTLNAGGLFGYMHGHITDSHNEGAVHAASEEPIQESSAGGLVGFAAKITVFKCFNEGGVSLSGLGARFSAGGIIGYATGDYDGKDIVSNAYNTGDISVDNAGPAVALVAGIVGRLTAFNSQGGIRQTTICNCHNTGCMARTGVPCTTESVDGIANLQSTAAEMPAKDFVASCFTVETESKAFHTDSSFVENTQTIEVAASEMADGRTFADAGWDLVKIWKVAGAAPSFRDAPAVQVTFDPMNGGDSVSHTVDAGEAVAPPAVERDGYAFGGWFTGKSGGGIRFDGLAPAEDATYHAYWTIEGKAAPPEVGDAGFGMGMLLLLIILFTAAAAMVCLYAIFIREGTA
jgi:hypothetical protein